MFRTNIDRTDEQLNTKAPFDYSCSMKLGTMNVPSCSFLSIRINVKPSIQLPVRLSTVYTDTSNVVMVRFSDDEGTVVGTATMPVTVNTTSDYVSLFLRDVNGAIVGHMTCQKTLPDILRAAAKLSGGVLNTSKKDFCLLPQCCIPVPDSKCTTFIIPVLCTDTSTGESETETLVTHASTRLLVDTPIQSTYATDGTLTLDRVEWFDVVPEVVDGTIVVGEQGITSVTVSGYSYDGNGRHLLLKAASRSNLRLTADAKANGLVLGGVKDEH